MNNRGSLLLLAFAGTGSAALIAYFGLSFLSDAGSPYLFVGLGAVVAVTGFLFCRLGIRVTAARIPFWYLLTVNAPFMFFATGLFNAYNQRMAALVCIGIGYALFRLGLR